MGKIWLRMLFLYMLLMLNLTLPYTASSCGRRKYCLARVAGMCPTRSDFCEPLLPVGDSMPFPPVGAKSSHSLTPSSSVMKELGTPPMAFF